MTITILNYALYILALLGTYVVFKLVSRLKDTAAALLHFFRVSRIADPLEKGRLIESIVLKQQAKYERRLAFVSKIPVIRYFLVPKYEVIVANLRYKVALVQGAIQMEEIKLKYEDAAPSSPEGGLLFEGQPVH